MSRKARFSLSLLGLAFGLLAACAPSMVVNSEGDEGDADLSNADCATVNNECTLRAAIQQANHDGNGAIITFENVSLITPASNLPILTDNAIRIRGEGNVTLDGAGLGGGATGINIRSSYNEIQGMTIINFSSAAIRIDAFYNETKSNIIGINPNSSADPATVRNVLGGNCNGVYITGEDAFGNTVAGNYIGTLADGSTANPNTCGGVVIIHGHDNVIGGVSTFVPEIDPSDQEAYWSFDEASGNRADSVGSNTLVETSGTIVAVPAKVNNGADFELADSEFFEVADNPDLSTGDIDFTLAGWVKLESEVTFQTLVSKYESTNNYEYLLTYNKNLDRFVFTIFNAANQSVGSVNNGTAVSANTWYYIVVWHDSVNNVVGIQINNGAASTSPTTGAPSDTGANFRMGADSATEGGFFDGVLDEWGFWKRLLTSQEKDTLYNNGNGYELQIIEQGSNIISANDGTGIYLGNATNNLITGNYIGTAKDGKTPLGNTSVGIYLTTSSHDNIIGIDAAGFGGAPNVISANGNDGISIQTNNNLIAGNFIGTDITGTVALGNGQAGIFMHNASGNVIGTNGDGVGDDQEGNVISGNGVMFNRAGIWLIGVNNVIAGNMIGTNVDGTAALGNSGSGITLGAGGEPGFSNRVGTNGDGVSDLLEANVISGNGGTGVFLASYQNQVSGNMIGTTADGMSALGNGYHGVTIGVDQHSNLIGTNGDGVADAAERNVISANGFNLGGTSGLAIYGSNNVVAGNYIGVNAAGTGNLGNAQYGVVISKSYLSVFAPQDNLIGTDGDGMADAAEANVISGNGWMGLVLSTEAANNQVSGNFIGTNSTGTSAIPNGFAYIGGIGAVQLHYGANGNVIGTNGDGVGDAAERNVISGNARRGVQISGQGTSNNTVAGNYIGTNAAGTSALGNASLGVEITSGASGNLIGTNGDGLSDALEANVISANGAGGIMIIVGSSNEIAGNFIGTDKNGTADLGNGQEGIEINASNQGGTNGNSVGGTPEKANVIAFNAAEGVEITGSDVYPVNTPVLYNSIFANGSIGINLSPSDGFYGITLNDIGDGDSGANNLMNFPVLDFALTLNSSISITGEIADGLPNTSFLIQFFSNTECDLSGNGEGKVFIGESTEMTNGSGDVSFLASFNVTVAAGEFITATATNSNNTSEFSECIEVIQGSQLSSTGQAPPNFVIIPLRDLNCRYYCTAQSDIADTLLVGIEYIPVGWDPEMGFFAFAGPTFGEICFVPPQTGGTELMTLQLNNQAITFDQLTLEDLPLFACPAFSTPTPTVDIDEGANPTETPRAPQCSDGLDNDGDGLIDYSAAGGGDPQCRNAADDDELNP